jgi:hypothetical protein
MGERESPLTPKRNAEKECTMPRPAFALAIALLLTLSIGASTAAMQNDPVDESTVLGWYRSEPRDWGQGAMFAGLGLVASLVTVFSAVGGVLPGTAGVARLTAMQKQVGELEARVLELANTNPVDTNAVTAIGAVANQLRDDFSRSQNRQFVLGALLYLVGGAAAAAIFAVDIVQALVIGAGWTGVVGAYFVRQDANVTGEVKNTVIADMQETIKVMNTKLTDPSANVPVPAPPQVQEMLSQATFARSL